jgi:small subunit ribosomal protein S24e
MNINIISKSENTVIGRKEFLFELGYEKTTPKKTDVREAIVTKTGVLPDTLVIKSINQHTGEKKATVIAYAYSDVELMMAVEPKYILRRNGFIKDEEKKDEKKPEEKK